MSTTEGTLKNIDPATLKDQMDQGKIVLIDVREPGEYARENIPGAILLPQSKFDPSQVPQEEGKRVVLHCAGGVRSEQVAKQLLAAGASEVTHLEGGFAAWRNAGLPFNENRKAPLPIMRQVQIIAGSLVVIGVVLGATVNPWWTLLSGFVGAGLTFAGVSGFCGMAIVLGKMPWNRV